MSGGYETLNDPTDWNATMALVEEMDDAELVYQSHSYDDLTVVEGSPEE